MSCWSTCSDCTVKFSHVRSDAKRSYCHECSLLQLAEKDAELAMLRSENISLKKLLSDLDAVPSTLQKQTDNFLGEDGIVKGDVRIIIRGRGDETLFAHKYILSSRSSVFRNIFDAKMREDETGPVFIDDASHEVVEAMIKFCYDSEIDFTESVTTEEVLQVAHKYDISLLKKICEERIISTISCENLPEMLKIAMRFRLTDLEQAAVQFFKDHFDEVVEDVLNAVS